MAEPLKVAYLFSKYPVASQTFCDTEMLGLERLGVNVVIGSVSPPSSSFRHEHASALAAHIEYAPHEEVRKCMLRLAENLDTWPADEIHRHEELFGKPANAKWRAANALHFAKTFREHGVNHVHVHFARQAAHTAYFLKKIAGIPYSLTAHAQDFIVDTPLELLREYCREAEFVVCVSEYSLKLLSEMCPESVGKFHRVYNGIDVQRFPRASRALSPVPRILSIGRLIEFKGFQHLIAALGQLKERGVSFECEIIGDGPLRGKLTRQITDLGLEECVQLPGLRSQLEVAKSLAQCDIFALASITDPHGASDILPTVILEAMASNKPVVSTRLAAIPEMVIDGQTGILIEPGDEKALADALFSLLSDHELRSELGAQGRLFLNENFAVEKTAALIKTLFEKYRSSAPLEPPRQSAFALLMDAWPHPSTRKFEESMARFISAPDAWPVFVCRPQLPLAESDSTLVHDLRFLPDPMVLEAEWKQVALSTREIEELREELSSKYPTGRFLNQARYALYLIKTIGRTGIRHIHVLGEQALVAAWILHRIRGVSFSVTLESPLFMSPTDLQTILSDASGGWLGEPVRDFPEPRFLIDGDLCLDERDATQLTSWLGVIFKKDPSKSSQRLQYKPLGTPEWRGQIEEWHKNWTPGTNPLACTPC